MSISSNPTRLKGAISGFVFGLICAVAATSYTLMFEETIKNEMHLTQEDFYIFAACIAASIVAAATIFGTVHHNLCNIFVSYEPPASDQGNIHQLTGSLNA